MRLKVAIRRSSGLCSVGVVWRRVRGPARPYRPRLQSRASRLGATHDTVVWHVDGKLVEHVTFFPGGDEFWATFTETGTVTFSEAGVDWSGHFTEWGNDNQNETKGNATFTTTINFTASDGSTAQGQDTSHVLWDGVQDPQDPNAVFKLAFDKLRIRDLTCAS
jgi:hypothetical protein